MHLQIVMAVSYTHLDVYKRQLRKCFKDKEDIASMAEGDNLEMLVEKVMELVRNLYL